MKTRRNVLSTPQKIVTGVLTSISVLVILFSVLQICEIWDKANCVAIPLLGVVNLCQAYLQWKINNRKTAYFSIGAAIFIFICSIAILLRYLK